MKILMINQPMSNRGDESAHKGLIRAILKAMPNVRITVVRVGMNPDTIRQFGVDDENVEYVNLPLIRGYLRFAKLGLQKGMYFLWRIHPTHRKIRALMLASDIVLSAPGGICMGGFQNWEHLFLLKMTQRIGKKLVYYGRSFGPFPETTKLNRCFKKHSVDMLHYFSFLSVRDKKTESIAKDLGISYVPTVDSAFLDLPRVEIPKELLDRIDANPYVVFVPNELIWHYAFRGKLSKTELLEFYREILSLIKEKMPNRKIVMLPQTYNQTTPNGNDINFFKEFEACLKDPSIIVTPDTYNSDIQQSIIANADLVVGARYHSIIFAINNNVPFVALSYEHKISGILETLGKLDCMVDISTALFSVEGRKRAVEDFEGRICLAHKDDFVQNKAREMSKACFDKFVLFLNGLKK